MIVRKYWTDQDDTITVEFDDGEPRPDCDDVLFLEGNDDNGLRVGRVFYDKFGVVTFEIIETGISGSYNEL